VVRELSSASLLLPIALFPTGTCHYFFAVVFLLSLSQSGLGGSDSLAPSDWTAVGKCVLGPFWVRPSVVNPLLSPLLLATLLLATSRRPIYPCDMSCIFLPLLHPENIPSLLLFRLPTLSSRRWPLPSSSELSCPVLGIPSPGFARLLFSARHHPNNLSTRHRSNFLWPSCRVRNGYRRYRACFGTVELAPAAT